MSYFFRNATVWSDGRASAADVLIEGNRIAEVMPPGSGPRDLRHAKTFDAKGCTIMPGLVDGHGHLAFTGDPRDWALIPIEEHVLRCMHNARTLLEAGFTSVISGGAVRARLDIAIRNEIAAGLIPGPRLLACSPEMTCTGGLGDDRHLHLDLYTYSMILDGPEEFRRTTRLFAREGADLVKVGISGNPGLAHASAEATLMTDAELAAVTTSAQSFGMRVAAHARSNRSVIMALEHGVDFIYHCEFADQHTIELLEAAKDRIFLAPAFAPAHARHLELEQASPRARDEATRVFDAFCTTYTAIRKTGVRVLIGGEYGLPETPHGTNARDIAHFVDFFGYSSDEALIAATKSGAEAMGMCGSLGEVRPGFLADVLLVAGRPDHDVRLLQNPDNIVIVMKDGQLHKSPHEMDRRWQTVR